MQRRLTLHPSLVVLLLLGVVLAAPCAPACAQTVTPAAEQQPAPFAYAAPALIQELDTKYPFPPPVPPSPPRAGGVLHLPAGVLRAFDPTVNYMGELALV